MLGRGAVTFGLEAVAHVDTTPEARLVVARSLMFAFHGALADDTLLWGKLMYVEVDELVYFSARCVPGAPTGVAAVLEHR